jgi:alkanesulfonate monooxygenase SsuD/methylene tetrahydromethanopterin reductase-like flavin-dependent oxidoreductase (luciferase family)
MTHPVYNQNKLKLGLFSLNCSNGCAISTAPEALKLDWRRNLSLSIDADAAGFELLVPIGRWRGFGGVTDFNGTNFETYTWAAGVGQATRDIGVMTTSHVPTIHPIVAAKQAITIDHITGGRFGLNIVCGWSQPEMEMFGAEIMVHDTRYDYAAEWVHILTELWTREEPLDFEGRFLRVKKAVAQPKPIQRPRPPLMNAGGSAKGRAFCAKYCDVAFLLLDPNDMDASRNLISGYRKFAREEFGRDLQIWCYAYVIDADTRDAAAAYLENYAVTQGDDVAVDNILRELGVQTQGFTPEKYREFRLHFKAGWGGFPLVGTRADIVEKLVALSEAGLDGVALCWLDYYAGLARWNREILPMIEQVGLRKPVRADAV